MSLTGTRTYVGFGFGAIQAGLFLHEAFESGNFRRLVIAEVVPEVVEALRRTGGRFTVNIAHPDRIEKVTHGPIEIVNPNEDDGRVVLIDALAEAVEIGTAVPSVDFYASDRPGSIHRLLAEGLRKKVAERGPRAVIYAAENHNEAAETLRARVLDAIPAAEHPAVDAVGRFLNTVIGKMSGIITTAGEIRDLDLATVTPGEARAFLVEVFNRILISEIDFETPFERGIGVFAEKSDLLPFEEAKLYGHNAVHALAAYVGALVGVERIADLREFQGALAFLRAAFIEESGFALVDKHGGTDPLFSWEDFREYADDLLDRMTNPFLRDTVERVGRDPERKLGWDDRLIGTMRLALRRGVKPRRFAMGAAAALSMIQPSRQSAPTPAALEAELENIWKDNPGSGREKMAVLELIEEGFRRLMYWKTAAFQDLELPFHREI